MTLAAVDRLVHHAWRRTLKAIDDVPPSIASAVAEARPLARQ
jgi:hypothetical protein